MNTNQELLNRIAELENSLALAQKRSDENFDNYKESEKNHADEIRKSMLLEYDLKKAKESLEYKDIEIARLKKEVKDLTDFYSSSMESTRDLKQYAQDYKELYSESEAAYTAELAKNIELKKELFDFKEIVFNLRNPKYN